MKTPKRTGIYMDHANAYLITFPAELMEEEITSAFTHEEKVSSLSKSEHLMHNKEQHEQSAYYKKLGDAIRNYDEVLLFGPTEAKSELLNLLKTDHLFNNIKIALENTDKLNDQEQQEFVNAYFSKK
jgi:stalled ribosome rescue protein Dom34